MAEGAEKSCQQRIVWRSDLWEAKLLDLQWNFGDNWTQLGGNLGANGPKPQWALALTKLLWLHETR